MSFGLIPYSSIDVITRRHLGHMILEQTKSALLFLEMSFFKNDADKMLFSFVGIYVVIQYVYVSFYFLDTNQISVKIGTVFLLCITFLPFKSYAYEKMPLTLHARPGFRYFLWSC